MQQNATHKKLELKVMEKKEIKEIIVHIEEILISKAWKEFSLNA